MKELPRVAVRKQTRITAQAVGGARGGGGAALPSPAAQGTARFATSSPGASGRAGAPRPALARLHGFFRCAPARGAPRGGLARVARRRRGLGGGEGLNDP